MTHAQRARRYIQASMNAGYTNLPAERREAYEAQMRAHERAYPGVREHALAGAGADFDAPLTGGEREHQAHMSRAAGLEQDQLLQMRKTLRAGDANPARRRPLNRRQQAGANARQLAGAGRSAAAATAGAGAGAMTAAGHGTGSSFLQVIGLLLGLSLIYLLVAGKGVNALTGITNAIVGGVTGFVRPIDPVKGLESALGAGPTSATSSSSSPSSSPASPQPTGAGSTAPTHSAGISGGPTAPPPSQVGAKVKSWKIPASLLEADLALRRKATAAVKAGTETVKQARANEERLIPRQKYPEFYAHQR